MLEHLSLPREYTSYLHEKGKGKFIVAQKKEDSWKEQSFPVIDID